MTLEQTFRLIFERKLKSTLRLSIPLPWLLGVLTLGLAWLSAYLLGGVFALLSGIDGSFKLWLGYALGLTLVVFTLIVTMLRSLSLRGLANESFAALPVATGSWARAASRYFYISQIPLALGIFLATALDLRSRAHIPWLQTLGIMCLIGLSIAAMVFAAYHTTIWALARNTSLVSAGGVIVYISLGAATAYAAYRLCTNHQLGSHFWLPALLFTGVIGLLFGLLAAVAAYLARPYTRAPLTLTDDSIGFTVSSRRTQRVQAVTLVSILLRIVLRDKKFWVVTGVNFLLVGLACALGLKAHSAQTNAFFVSFLPTLLILGQASGAAEIRGQSGGTREAIYALPLSPRQVTLALTTASFTLIASTVVPAMLLLSTVLKTGVTWDSVTHLLLLSLLAALVACATSVLFFESRRDASRGILAGVILFLLLLPVLALNGWLRSKNLVAAIGLSVSLAALLYEATALLEQKLLIWGK